MTPAAHFASQSVPPRPPLAVGDAGREGALQSALQVLIVEDNWLAAMEMESTLQDAGYGVVGIVVSADEAIRACEENRPDLVLMDIRLLGARDGVDAALEIRERFGIGAIFVSAHDDAEMRSRAKAAQPLGWLVKPVTGSELLRSLAALRRNQDD